MRWSWGKRTRAELVLLLAGFACAIISRLITDISPDLSLWVGLAVFPCVIAMLVLAYNRWDNGRIHRDVSED